MSTINALDIRRRLGRNDWHVPDQFGPDGWRYDNKTTPRKRIIVTVSDMPNDEREWVHASISRVDQIPDYDDLVLLHAAVWPGGHAYQCFVPPSEHVNIHAQALHLWGLRAGDRILPDFGFAGSI
jgi:hypothetical protein